LDFKKIQSSTSSIVVFWDYFILALFIINNTNNNKFYYYSGDDGKGFLSPSGKILQLGDWEADNQLKSSTASNLSLNVFIN